MKENKLIIQINKPINQVFAYTVIPPNAKYWVPNIVDEKTSEWPVRVGSIYFEKTSDGKWLGFYVSAINKNELFELVSEDGNYHVRYTYKPTGPNSCELEYYEWVDKGELLEPFSANVLEKLKSVMENHLR